MFSEKMGNSDQPLCLCPSCGILVCITMCIKFPLGLQQCLTGYIMQMLEWPVTLKADISIKDSHQPTAWCLVLVVPHQREPTSSPASRDDKAMCYLLD